MKKKTVYEWALRSVLAIGSLGLVAAGFLGQVPSAAFVGCVLMTAAVLLSVFDDAGAKLAVLAGLWCSGELASDVRKNLIGFLGVVAASALLGYSVLDPASVTICLGAALMLMAVVSVAMLVKIIRRRPVSDDGE